MSAHQPCSFLAALQGSFYRLRFGRSYKDAWKSKFGQLCNELAVVEGEIAALETAQDRFFETADLVLKLAGQLGETYMLGDTDRKRALLKLVASKWWAQRDSNPRRAG